MSYNNIHLDVSANQNHWMGFTIKICGQKLPQQILFLSAHGRPYRLSSMSMMPMIYHLWIRDEWHIVPQVEPWTLYQTPTSRSETTAASASKITELEPRDDALLSTCIYEYGYQVKGLNILRVFPVPRKCYIKIENWRISQSLQPTNQVRSKCLIRTHV